MAGATAGEIAARVVVGAIEMAERRAEIMPRLSAAVAKAVDELDPGHERDTSPTWWQDLPPWQHLDSVDRLRLAHDQLFVLEEQATGIVDDLRGFLRRAPAGSAERPHGYTPARAHFELCRLGLRRFEYVGDLRRGERVVRARLSRPVSAWLREQIRSVGSVESLAGEERQRLTDLLSGLPEAG